MRLFTRFLFLSAVALIGAIIQEFHLCAIGGVVPNFLLVFFAVLIVRRERFLSLVLIGCALSAVAALFVPFWIAPFALLAATVILLFLLSHVLTGNHFTDTFILVACGTVALSAMSSLAGGIPFQWLVTVVELVLNLLVAGIVTFFAFRNFPSIHRPSER